MTEEIILRLSMIRGLRVISRTSAMHFKDTRAPLPEIAKALGVDAIVEGSVIREGGRVRVHAQLIRAATDEHFWSETYDRELGDALGLESDVAQTIAGRVEVTVTGAERARLVAARQVSPDVYENSGQLQRKKALLTLRRPSRGTRRLHRLTSARPRRMPNSASLALPGLLRMKCSQK